MKRLRLIQGLVLVLSLGFNAAVLAGFAFDRWFPSTAASTGPKEYQQPMRGVDLSASQREQLQRANQQTMGRLQNTRRDTQKGWLRVVDALAADDIDWKAVRSGQYDIEIASQKTQASIVDAWEQRARLLNLQQRKKLFGSLRSQIESGAFFNWRVPDNRADANKSAARDERTK